MARALRSEINVTPLVDIVLVLLIVFIIAAPAVDASVKLPLAKHAEKGVVEGPRISLRREGRHARASLEAGGEPSGRAALSFRIGEGGDGAALATALQRLGPAQRERPVLIKADAALSNALVGELLAACRAGGATRATIITGEESGTPSRRL